MGGAALLGTSVWTPRSSAQSFGEIPSGAASSMLPEGLRAESVLECFLLGGLVPWESFYCMPGRGQAEETWAYTNYGQLMKAAEGCGFEGAAADPFTFFGKDSAGQEVFLGPYMGRLRARPDVLERVRVVVNRHGMSPHEAAIPMAATGRSLGSERAAGLSTHVSRYFVDREVSSSGGPPLAYHFGAPSGFAINDSAASLSALGLHPGRARPLRFNLDSAARLQRLLARSTVGSLAERTQYDALVSLYFDEYARHLHLGEGSEIVRAEQFDDLRRSFSKQKKTDVIRSMLPESAFEPWLTPRLCREVRQNAEGGLDFAQDDGAVTPSAAGNLPAMGLRLATHLLTHPTHRARHCAVVDSGVRQADSGGGYDTHTDGPWRQATNLNNLLEHLLGFINEPGENNPNKLDLDKTMVILNTEFGRAPGRQTSGSRGRNHWPHGFVQVYIGGPIRKAQAGYYGSIAENGYASVFTTPAENRMAALLALGIYPFDGASFSSGDVQGQSQDSAAARSVIERVLGHVV